MSRIGNKVIVLPAGVELTNNDNVITVKGPKYAIMAAAGKRRGMETDGYLIIDL
nr:hypothetical protein [Neisseria sp. HMSC069H12]